MALINHNLPGRRGAHLARLVGVNGHVEVLRVVGGVDFGLLGDSLGVGVVLHEQRGHGLPLVEPAIDLRRQARALARHHGAAVEQFNHCLDG